MESTKPSHKTLEDMFPEIPARCPHPRSDEPWTHDETRVLRWVFNRGIRAGIAIATDNE